MTPVYEWYRRGLQFLATGDTHAAATVLERAVAAEPDKASLRESLARAYYGSGRYRAALEQFSRALDIDPVNDYAHFGAGLCLGRLGRLDEAVGHLKLAATMRPDNREYQGALSRHVLRRRLRDRRRGTG